MKAFLYNNSLLKTALAIVILAFANISAAQTAKADESSKVQDLIEAKRFLFKAQSVHPARGRVVHLNSEYDLKVSGDTVRSYLPYFGRAYSAPMNNRGGIDFTSSNFQYNTISRKKGGWDISIKPSDVNDVREMHLTVFENGSASLRVLSTNREVISFNGYLEEI